jgi:hypothetical protein
MYGFGGDHSALEWAELNGLNAVFERDRAELIKRGYFTPCGIRTDKKVRVEIS